MNYLGDLTNYLLFCEQYFAEKRSELERLIREVEQNWQNESEVIALRKEVLGWIGQQFDYTERMESEELDNKERTLLISIIDYLDRKSSEFANMSDEGTEMIRKIVEQKFKKKEIN